jgi:Glycosyl hydrolases family 16
VNSTYCGAVNRLLIPAAVLVGCFAAASGTHANGTLVRDHRADVKGGAVLDNASVQHGRRARLLAHRLRTYRPWQAARLANHELDSTRPPTRRVPAPIARRGYRQVFGDEFNTFNARRWSRSIWYEDPAARGDIYTRKGILHLVSRRSSRYPNVSVTTLRRRHFRGGYFEARLRWTKGNGSWPGFWLFSVARASGNVPSPEIDVFEGQGSEPRVYYGTVHRNSSDCCAMPNRQNGNNWQLQRIDLTAGFHTYAALWGSTSVTWYLDGRRLMKAPVYDTTDNDMFLILDMWTGGWTRGTDIGTPAELHTEVDWVRVWQK